MPNEDHVGHKKEVSIFVNGQEKHVEKELISYEELIILAFGAIPENIAAITITYTRGHGEKPEGSVVAGGNVKIKDGMIFNVKRTDRS